MTKWFHKCDLKWLQARQNYLTATDVKELLPVTKTGRKRTVSDENYYRVIANKLINLTEADCISTGAAARGHILEPYAIERYNKVDYGDNEYLWHWDDIVVIRPHAQALSLAFSPDAMNHIMLYEPRKNSEPVIDTSMLERPSLTIGEVKSYSAERHLICGHTNKLDLEERWQIATAMAVSPMIENAYLLFYNPSMTDQLYIVDYDRSDLEDEIAIILEVENNWLAWSGNFIRRNFDEHFCVIGNKDEEEAIIRSIMKKEELNPEGMRSVTNGI